MTTYNLKKDISQKSLSRVLDRSRSGWETFYLKDGTKIHLCYSTRLKLIEKTYEILEGKYRGQLVDIKDFSLLDDFSYLESIKSCTYVQKENLLILPDKTAIKTVKQSSLIPTGEYFIGLPIAPERKLTKKLYMNEAKKGSRFASTWFPLIKSNGKTTHFYIHLGKFSNGCITVEFPLCSSKWTDLFTYLLSHRTANGHLMMLEVK